MDKIKSIKTEQDYSEALKLIEELMNLDPDPDSDEGQQLSVLATLIKEYEAKSFPKTLPNPVEAIKFRMEQEGLQPSELEPYIGSRGRVSEILSGKRPLTLEMMRALEAGLGIPAKVLIQKPDQNLDPQDQQWDMALVKTMTKRGYFGNVSLKKFDKEELIRNFFSLLQSQAQPVALFRKTNFRSLPRTDKKALSAWMIRVLEKAKKLKPPVKYKHGIIDIAFMQNLVKLSIKDNGPVLAQEYLLKHGIILILEPHLPKTHLDGAAILSKKDNPVIGLTIRHDRPDNFWFTLMHELAHVALHYGQEVDLFYDEKLQDKDGVEINDKEVAADNLAEEAILPKSKWEISNAKVTPNPMAVQSLANELGIHVTVIAGIVRFKHQNYYYLTKIVNDGSLKVRKFFPNDFKNL